MLALLALLPAAPTPAQPGVEEVVVTAPPGERRALQPAIEIDHDDIVERAPVTLTDIFRGLPSVGIRTNSRGEAVLRLRGSEERQTSLFLDGAPLSVPWDGRVDLHALPAGIVDEVRVTPSAAPIEFGANSVLGAVDIRTPVTPVDGLRSVQAEIGPDDTGSISATGGTSAGELDLLFGATYRQRGGEAVADPAAIPYGPVDDGVRRNTDLEAASLFVSAATAPDWGVLRASWLSVAADRGIANAGHIDPAAGSPRYWRYPHWRFDQFTVNASTEIGAGLSLRSTAWLQHFEQTIDQYTDSTYSTREASEDDEDNTSGLRLVLERPFEAFDLRVVGNAQTTRHDQVNVDYGGEGRGPRESYRQNVMSLGAEIDAAPRDDFVVSAALSYDLATTPRTGGRPAQEDLSDWAASVAARWHAGDNWEVAGTLGQRTRFPTLRELYGEALGTFLLNPDLRPETALLGDLTLTASSDDGSHALRITPWVLQVEDTLSRRSVVVDGTRLRQRYNLEGSQGYGLEAAFTWIVDDRLEIALSGNWQRLDAEREADGSRPALYQRPDLQAALVLDYVFAQNWDLFLELRHTGEALDEDEDGRVVTLPSSTEINLRIFRTLGESGDGRWRAYAGIDNLTDELVLPQLGLPQPGRTALVGVTFERL